MDKFYDKFYKNNLQLINTQYRHRFKPSQFQHIGTQSSFDGKIQQWKDHDFGQEQLHTPHIDNPSAHVSTSLRAYQNTIDKAYRGENFFWSLRPQPNDFVQIDFDQLIRLEGRQVTSLVIIIF
jgi:hypothetical protein